MIETQNKKIDVNALIEQVNQTLAAGSRCQSDKSGKNAIYSVKDSIGTNLIKISTNWTIAEQFADISQRSLQMVQYPKPIRWLAKLSGKILLYFNQVITIPQTNYNLNLLLGLRSLTDTLNKLLNRIDILENIISYQQSQLSLLNKHPANKRQMEPLTNSAEDHSRGARDDPHQHCLLFAGYPENRHLSDNIYQAFEDQFRGSRGDIKEKLSVYLPLIKEAAAGSDNRPVLDSGCGRGEWLELLQENRLKSTGIDINGKFIEQCLERGFKAIRIDVLDYLQTLPDNSLGAVTAFHLIEHLPFQVLIRFYGETLRVLKPGGIAIFETPNPQNLMVGACDFWSDPTHLKPLFPDTQKFLMRFKGFTKVRLIYLHPHDEDQRLPEKEAPQLAHQLNTLLTGARDYAVIGYKYTA